MINRYIGGSNLKYLNNFINRNKFQPIINYIGEYNDFYDENKRCIEFFKNKYIALKLTSLGLPNEKKAFDNSRELCKLAIKNNNKILIDAENYKNKIIIGDISNDLIKEFNTDKIHIYKTFQMYYKDSPISLENQLNTLPNSGIKLVRGAYLNEDRKFNVLSSSINETHFNYNSGIDVMLDYKKNQTILATHNDYSCYYAFKKSKEIDFFNYCQLLGMNDKLSHNLLKENANVFKYIPYGPYNLCLPYLIRRLYENIDSVQYIFK